MKHLLFSLVIASHCLGMPFEAKKITELDATEPYTAQIFHGGFLWVGRSRRNLATLYEIELYNSTGQLVSRTTLSHALNSIQAYGPNSVLIVGRQPKAQSSHSIVTWNGKSLAVRTTLHPPAGFAEDGTGIPEGPTYLVMIGGESPPPSSNPLGDPEGYRTLFIVKNANAISYLSTKLHNVGLVQQVGGFIYAIERHGMGAGDENLTRINLKTQKAERVFPKANRKDLHKFILLDDNKTLVASESDVGKIHFIDTTSNSLLSSIDIPAGSPKAIAQWYDKLVVGSQVSRKLTFIQMKQGQNKVLCEWDLNHIDSSLSNIVNVSADPKTKASLFALRSLVTPLLKTVAFRETRFGS